MCLTSYLNYKILCTDENDKKDKNILYRIFFFSGHLHNRYSHIYFKNIEIFISKLTKKNEFAAI